MEKECNLTLAVDLEATLVVSADCPWSRPGLRDFLDWTRAYFARVVVFTAVDEPLLRQVAEFLVSRGEAPEWFAHVDHLRAAEYPDEEWDPALGEMMCKDLRRIDTDLNRVVLLDDHEGYVLPSQKHRWVPIAPYDGAPGDNELSRVRLEILEMIKDLQ